MNSILSVILRDRNFVHRHILFFSVCIFGLLFFICLSMSRCDRRLDHRCLQYSTTEGPLSSQQAIVMPTLPLELERQIFELATLQDTDHDNRVGIMLVAKRVHEWYVSIISPTMADRCSCVGFDQVSIASQSPMWTRYILAQSSSKTGEMPNQLT